MNNLTIEAVLHWSAVGLYIAAMVAYAHSVIFEHSGRLKYGNWLALLGLAPHTASLAMRWVASGHGPYILKHEVLSADAWVAVAMLLVFVWRRPRWAAISVLVMPVAFTIMAISLFTNPAKGELPPTLRSIWLVFHVTFNKLSAGAYLLSLATSTVLLLQRGGATWAWLKRLPKAEALDAFTVRFIGFGFIFWTITIVAGAIWANESWGRYWGWDVIETWSLVTWLLYGSLLHLRRFFRIGQVTMAWGAIACFAMAILTIFILPYVMPSLHAAYFQ